MLIATVWDRDGGGLLIVCCIAAAYAGARALVDALAGAADELPGRRAVGHWLPIAAVALAAMWTAQPEAAVAIVFATSVACLSLANGMALMLHPVESLPRRHRRLWGMVLPVAVLALLAGFHARLSWIHALVLAIEGLAILLMCLDHQTPERPPLPQPTAAPVPHRSANRRIAEAVLGLGLAGLAAWTGALGISQLTHRLGNLTSGAVTATVLGPGLVTSLLGLGSSVAYRGRPGLTITTNAGVMLLNLCLLLPLLIVLSYVAPQRAVEQPALPAAIAAPAAVPAATAPAPSLESPAEQDEAPEAAPAGIAPHTEVGPGRLVVPILSWRVDIVALVVLGLLLLPAAFGLWQLGIVEGVALAFGYAAYLLVIMAYGRR